MSNFPLYARAQLVPVIDTSAAHLLTAPAAASARDVLIYNPGPLPVRATVGGASAVADDLSMLILPGERGAYGKGTHSHIAVVCSSAQDIEVFVGEGA